MALITYEDKIATRTLDLPRKNAVTAEDLNEIKAVVNANATTSGEEMFWLVDLLDYNSFTAIAPFDMKGTSVVHLLGNAVFTITVNGSPFVLNDPISAGSSIVFSVADATAFTFYFEKIT